MRDDINMHQKSNDIWKKNIGSTDSWNFECLVSFSPTFTFLVAVF
jgi:hypothetical protein